MLMASVCLSLSVPGFTLESHSALVPLVQVLLQQLSAIANEVYASPFCVAAC